jgi:hypothetical protein
MDHAERVVVRLKGRRLSYKIGLVFQSYLRYRLWSWHGKDIHGVRGDVTQAGR